MNRLKRAAIVLCSTGTDSSSFQTKGTVNYHCNIHPGMIGSIVVH